MTKQETIKAIKDVAIAQEQIKDIKDDIVEVRGGVEKLHAKFDCLHETFVTKEQHNADLEPLKRIMYGVVVAVLIAIITLLINSIPKINAIIQ